MPWPSARCANQRTGAAATSFHITFPSPMPTGGRGPGTRCAQAHIKLKSPPGYASAPPAWRCTYLGQQGAGVAELLEAFDEVGKKHERMEADEFNDDGTYKAGINQVGVA